ncbi:hypothetical protein HF086_005136, partial [Spodoptera exigua]
VNDHLSDHNYYLSSAPESPTLVTSHIGENDTVESDVQNDLEDKQQTSSLIENPVAVGVCPSWTYQYVASIHNHFNPSYHLSPAPTATSAWIGYNDIWI